MDIVAAILAHSNELWMQILIIIGAIGALLKGIEAILQIIAPLTKWTWDDNLATMLGKILANKVFQKKLVLIFALGLVLTGCAAIQKQVDAVSACKADTACSAQMDVAKNVSSTVASTIAAAIPNPAVSALAPIVGTATGGLVAILAGMFLGGKLLKKKEEDDAKK